MVRVNRIRSRPRKLTQEPDAQIEYLVVTYDDDKHQVRLSLRQADILEALANDEKLTEQGGGVPDLQSLEKK